MTRPVLLGMNNPLSLRPEHALWPDPPGCTGWRLWRMIADACGATAAQYLAAFDRRNGLSQRAWSARDAAEAGRELARTASGTWVVLGAATWLALGLGARPWPLGCLDSGRARWHALPHPSGRCLWYNDQAHRAAAGELLARLGGLS